MSGNCHDDHCAGVHLTVREVDVLALLCQGYTNADVARLLFISPVTVAHHVANMQSRLRVRNRAQLVAVAVVDGVLTSDRWPMEATGRRCVVTPQASGRDARSS
jgi:DNA-binding CsgD family transcriptional regulator